MPTRIIQNNSDAELLFTFIRSSKYPLTVNVTKGKNATYAQEKLARMWHKEAEEQGDQTAEEYRGYCKLQFGCAILYHENEEFAEAFDTVLRPLSYENKLKSMMIPLDMPITRIMRTSQKKRYLDEVYQFYKGQGFILTEPEEK